MDWWKGFQDNRAMVLKEYSRGTLVYLFSCLHLTLLLPRYKVGLHLLGLTELAMKLATKVSDYLGGHVGTYESH